ncbi:hypothetical protein [cyanobacterium endosymbiont of Epithemia turgida]
MDANFMDFDLHGVVFNGID